MALFNTRIKELESQLSEAIGERDKFKASVEELTQANAECEKRFAADQEQIATLAAVTKERDELKAKVETPEARETAITAEVNKRLGSVGGPAIKRDQATVASDEALYDEFKAAGPVKAQALMTDPVTASRIRAESARRLAATK